MRYIPQSVPPFRTKNALFSGLWRFALPVWFFCAGAKGHYVIPYELRIGEGPQQKLYTVLVILADHYANYYGEGDGLAQLMAKNFHSDSDVFLNKYLTLPYSWYLDQVVATPKVYGDAGDEITEGMREFESMADGKSSAVVITEHRRLDKILAFLRVDTGDVNGRLTSENHFLNKGFDGVGFPQTEPNFVWSQIADFRAEAYQTEFHRLGFPKSDRFHYWLEGENIELKNFGMDPATFRKLFKYLYLIGHDHKMFDWGVQKFPKELTAWPDGTPIPATACHRYGRRVSHLWLDAYSEDLMRYYARLGFKVWKKLNNVHTKFRDLYFMFGEVREVDAKMRAKLFDGETKHHGWLVQSDELTAEFHSATCVEDLLQLHHPVPKLRKKNKKR